jgi:Spy/CpxP family protein refolding chaperone
MARSLVPVLSLAALLAACSHNSARSTIEPGGPNSSVADGRDGRGRGGPGGPGGFGRADQALLRGITLNTDQQQRIDSIRTRYRAQTEQMRQQNGTGDRDAMRTQMRTAMEKQQAEIRAVLTPDQQTQFDQNVAEMRNRMQQGGGRPGGAPPV